jgi:hypothetical protein
MNEHVFRVRSGLTVCSANCRQTNCQDTLPANINPANMSCAVQQRRLTKGSVYRDLGTTFGWHRRWAAVPSASGVARRTLVLAEALQPAALLFEITSRAGLANDRPWTSACNLTERETCGAVCPARRRPQQHAELSKKSDYMEKRTSNRRGRSSALCCMQVTDRQTDKEWQPSWAR